MSDLAIITCHYNWQDYDTPKRNLHRFLRQMDRAKVPVYGIELAFPNRDFQTTGRKGWRQYRVNHQAILWQKEALLNEVAKTLVPEEIEYLAFIDADVEFQSPDWVRNTSMALKHHPIIQMFDVASWTSREGAIDLQRTPVAKDRLDMDKWTTHPGFAWAMRRDFFNAIGGWYDVAPMGAGDTALAFALEKRPPGDVERHKVYSYIGQLNWSRFDKWCERVKSALRGKAVGWIPGELVHEWHGDRAERNYHKRGELIRGFDAMTDLKKSPNGYWLWTRKANKQLVRDMKDYFANRNEDGKEKSA